MKNADRIIAMWGILVGIAIGAGQIMALKALIGLIMGSGKTALKLLAAMLIVIKVAVIVLILYLLSTVSLTHVIWAAGGMLIGLIAASVILTLRRKKTEKDEHINREHA